jgi:uncharacterized integral membrane protein
MLAYYTRPMFSLIILFIFGFMAAIFAVQNTQMTNVQFGQYGFTDIPLFAIVLAAALFGVFVSWLISLTGNISTTVAMRGKDGQIKDARTHISKLESKIKDLEAENAELRHGEPTHTHEYVEQEEKRPVNPFVKLRQRFS